MQTRPTVLGVVMDPISTIKPHKDSSFAMLLEAQRRGWELRYMEMGDMKRAEPYVREANRIVELKLSELHGQRTRVTLKLAELLLATGQYDECEQTLIDMHARLWAAEDGSRSRKEWTAALLTELYEKQGKEELVQHYRAERDTLEAAGRK